MSDLCRYVEVKESCVEVTLRTTIGINKSKFSEFFFSCLILVFYHRKIQLECTYNNLIYIYAYILLCLATAVLGLNELFGKVMFGLFIERKQSTAAPMLYFRQPTLSGLLRQAESFLYSVPILMKVSGILSEMYTFRWS